MRRIVDIIVIICIIFLAWFIISYVDVIMHNSSFNGGPALPWNMFKVLF